MAMLKVITGGQSEGGRSVVFAYVRRLAERSFDTLCCHSLCFTQYDNNYAVNNGRYVTETTRISIVRRRVAGNDAKCDDTRALGLKSRKSKKQNYFLSHRRNQVIDATTALQQK